jgi:hypothetical protein
MTQITQIHSFGFLQTRKRRFTERSQRLPGMERLDDFLVKHFDRITAYCFHRVRSVSWSRSTLRRKR